MAGLLWTVIVILFVLWVLGFALHVGGGPVSYTHLGRAPATGGAVCVAPPGGLIVGVGYRAQATTGVCLLYTSRCV